MVRRLVLLCLVVQPLVEPLARPDAGDLDRDVVVGAQAGEADHLARQSEDRGRLAHVEEEDLATVGHGAGLQHEADRLRDGHEVPGHVLAGDRHRPPVEDLAKERRHDAAAAPQHVAEPHRGVGQIVTAADADHDVLGRPLRGPHHRAGMGGLVGGEVDEPLAAVVGGGVGQPPRAQHVGVGGLRGVALEDGNVLVGGRVEDHLGPGLLEQCDHPVAITQVEQDDLGAPERPDRDVVEERLVAVEEQEATGLVAGDLVRDLAADRAARSRHEHGGAAEVVADALGVDRRGLPAQQVAQVDVADVLEHPRARVGGRVEHLHLGLGAQGAVDDRLRLLPAGVGEGDEDPVDPVPAAQLFEVARAAEHGDAAQRSAVQAGVVVDEAHHVDVAARLGVRELVGQGGPGAAGARRSGPAPTWPPACAAARARRGGTGSARRRTRRG